MASIAGIKGISYAPYRGGWKLRWRELHQTDSGVVRKARSYTEVDEAEVPLVAVEIHRALDRQGWWEPDGDEGSALIRPLEVDIEALSGEWLVRR